MDNFIQNIESTVTNAVSAIEPKIQEANTVVTPKLNTVASLTSSAFNSIFDWIAINPKIFLIIVIFIMGFLCGILF